MKQYKHFFGVDISKKTIDVSHLQDTLLTHRLFTNDQEGMAALLHWLKEGEIDFTQALFCMEATGLYCFVLTEFLAAKGIDTWVEHAAQIKKQTLWTEARTTR